MTVCMGESWPIRDAALSVIGEVRLNVDSGLMVRWFASEGVVSPGDTLALARALLRRSDEYVVVRREALDTLESTVDDLKYAEAG